MTMTEGATAPTGEPIEAAPTPPDAPAPTGRPFRALLVIVGEVTSDRRTFDQLQWREPPLTVYSQLENSEGHRDAPIVGRLDRIVMDQPLPNGAIPVWGYGILDTDDEHARRTIDFIEKGYLRGVSIDAAAWDVYDDENEVRHYSSGEILAFTIVGTPAFRDTQIELLAEMPDLPAEIASPAMSTDDGFTAEDEADADEALRDFLAASGSTSLPLADRDHAWDGPAAARRVKAWAGGDTPNAKYASAFFVVDGPKDQYGSYHLGFADVLDGTLTAIPRGIIAAAGAVRGARGASNPAFQAAKPRIARYYRRMEMDPPWEGTAETSDLDVGVGLVASARPIVSASAFQRADMRRAEGLHIEDDGRVWGHIYAWGQCHQGSPRGECITVPRSRTGYAYFLTGSVLTDQGRIPVGQIAISTDHAPLNLGWMRARDHYANTGLVAADVTCGDDQYGIWVAGMIRPGAAAEVVHAFHAAGEVSGDWRPIGGALELVAILTVNMGGYPSRGRARPLNARFEAGDLVALVASMPMRAHACGCGGTDGLSEVLERMAAVELVAEEYRAKVRAEQEKVIAQLERDLGLDAETLIAAMEAEIGA